MLDAFKALRQEGATLPIVGLALAHAWILAPFLSGESFYICFHLGFSCMLLLCAALYHRRPQGSCLAAVMPWIAAAFMCLGTVAVLVTQGNLEGLDEVCGILGGAGSGYCFVRWFEVFCRLTPKVSVDATLLSFSISGCVRLMLVVLQAFLPLALLVLLVCFPVCSAILLTRCGGGDGAAEGHVWEKTVRPAVGGAGADMASAAPSRFKTLAYAGKATSAAARIADVSRPFPGWGLFVVGLELVAYGLAFGVLRNGINEWSLSKPSMLLGHMLRIVLPLLLFWWLQARSCGQESGFCLRVAFLVVAVALLAIVFLTGLAQSAISAIVLAARSFISVLIYVRLFDIVHRRGTHPCVAFGIGRALYEIGLVCGLLVYDTLLVQTGLTTIPFNITYFAVSCILLVMLGSFINAMRLPVFQPVAAVQAVAPATVETLSLDEACARLVGEYGLSEREAEVMRFICIGYTKRRIAETLSLSEDTVRYHTKSLYRKLDVHSRQDLLDLVGIG